MNDVNHTIRIASAFIVLLAPACSSPGIEDGEVVEREVAVSDCAPGDSACSDDPCKSDDGTCPPPSPCAPGDTSCTKTGSTGGGADVCAELAKELEMLLPYARACNVAAVPPQDACSAILPTLPAGCATAANPANEETQKYKEVWDAYAASCPLAKQPCPSTDGFVGACTQSPDVDGLAGVCELLKSAADADQAAD